MPVVISMWQIWFFQPGTKISQLPSCINWTSWVSGRKQVKSVLTAFLKGGGEIPCNWNHWDRREVESFVGESLLCYIFVVKCWCITLNIMWCFQWESCLLTTSLRLPVEWKLRFRTSSPYGRCVCAVARFVPVLKNEGTIFSWHKSTNGVSVVSLTCF